MSQEKREEMVKNSRKDIRFSIIGWIWYIQIKSKEGKMRPEEALLKFLKEDLKLELDAAEKREKRLSKYVLPGSRFYKIYFPQLKYGEMHEDIMKVVWNEEKSPDRAEIITRCKYDRNAQYKYLMARKEGNWLIKDYAYTCAICRGKGCDRCKDGWIKETSK